MGIPLLLLSLLAWSGWADSVVVFNEIMYHPGGTNEAALEWVELQSQTSVDLDLSGWRLDRAIHYTFPEGTVLPAGAYLVAAASPAALAGVGVSNALGPFTGRLGNGGDTLQLRNNTDRLMDEVAYGVEKDWPVAPDGAGPSLARRARNLATADSESWRASLEMGGTPGRGNFPVAPPPEPLAFNECSPVTNAVFWVEVINLGPTNFDLGGVILTRVGKTNLDYTLPAQTLGPGGLAVIAKADTGFGADPGDRLFLAAADRRRVYDAMVAKREGRARFPDGTGAWLHPAAPTPGGSNQFAFHDELVINEIMYHQRELPAVPAVFTNTTLLAATNAWRYRADGTDLGTAWREPGYDDASWPSSNALFYNTPAPLAAPKNTWLPLTNAAGARITTFYFRTWFNFAGSTNGLVLTLRPLIDDGAVFYLNGREVFRFNLPDGDILYGTLANTNVGTPAFVTPTNLPSALLLPGPNTLAVEVHQVVTNSSDAGFGAELIASGQLSLAEPFRDSPESWLEIYNRSSHGVDLTGWRLAGGIDYGFAPGTTLSAGGYLVVAKDADYMRSNYPAITVVGPFTNKLSKTSDLVSLRDASDNPANEVRYFDDGRWPEYADGGGSSLELRDPRADNTAAEAWAASDESTRSAWQTYTWRGVSEPGQAGEPTLWHEFALCLLDGPGEVLLDDISVIETPATVPKQLIQNGSFGGGSAAHWRLLGTHRRSRVEAEPGNPGNYVLHLVASGSGEYQGNQIETTLTNNTAIVDGREYEISFRAKWLAGASRLNARLYFNRLARTLALAVPEHNGTPGAPNSRRVANIGPTFSNLTHSPVIPNPGQAVAVSTDATDPDGVASATLKYSVNGGAWQSAPMTATPLNGSTLQRFNGTIPGANAGAVVNFYVQAADALGAAAAFPAGGTNARALYVVQDGQANTGPPRNLRLIMTGADTSWLLTGTNTASNDLLGGTVIADESEVFYDAGVRLKGSFVGRNVPYVGFEVYFPSHQLFRGVHGKVAVDRNVGGELLAKQIINHAGGLPGTCDDVVRFIGPIPSYSGSAQIRLSAYDNDYLDAQFRQGSDGPEYEYEVLRYSTGTVDGNPESPKLMGDPGGPNGYVNYDFQDWGNNPESYRWANLLVNNRTADDFSPAMALGKLFSLTGASLPAAAPAVVDVDEWLRFLACQSLVGPGDAFFTGWNKHNFRFYARPEDGRVLYLQWDWDSAFWNAANASIYGSGNVTGLFNAVANQRAFLNHLQDIMATSFQSAYLSRWATHYGALLGQDNTGYLSYIEARRTYVAGQLPAGNLFVLTNHAGNNFSVASPWLSLAGIAPIMVNQIEVNGVAYPVTWTSLTNWSVTVPLDAGANNLLVRGLDLRGQPVGSATDAIVVTNTGASAFLPVVINEWMADNKGPGGLPDPADGLFQDWFELFNPNPGAVNLSGHYLTDTLTEPAKWQIPTDIFISGLGHLLVWADGNTNQNPVAGGTNVDLHASFQLNNSGEALGLFAVDGVTPISTVTFGLQVQNVSQGLFPDGNTNTLFFMTNWTPRAANTLDFPPPPRLLSITQAGLSITLTWEALPGRACQVEFKESLANALWLPLGAPVRSSGPIGTYVDILEGPAVSRFYRVELLE